MKKLLLLILSLIFVSCSIIGKSTPVYSISLDDFNLNLELYFEDDKAYLTCKEQFLYFLPFEVKNDKLTNQALKITISGDFPGEVVYEQNGYKKTTKSIIISKDKNEYYKREQNMTSKDIIDKEIIVKTDDGETLSGTLSYLDERKDRACVLLVSGSGAQDRNSTVFNHKPFLVISNFLVENGYAVARFDDRGVGKSSGNLSNVSTLDLAEDAKNQIDYLKSLGYKNISIIGHSEGGIISYILSHDNYVNKAISLAGPIISGLDTVLDQNNIALISLSDEIRLATLNLIENYFTLIIEGEFDKAVELGINLYGTKELSKMQTEAASSTWYKEFLTLNPFTYLEKAKVPTTIIYGGKDVQVNSKLNEKELNKIKNDNISYYFFNNLNHMMQNAITGSINEYQEIEETINDEVLSLLLEVLK